MKNFIDKFCRIVTVINIIAFLAILFLISNKELTMKWMANYLIRVDEAVQADAIVILGGMEVYNRLDEGAELYHAGYSDKIIVSDSYSAENMKNGLIERGVDEGDIILESRAEDTYENAIYSRDLMIEYNFDSIILVTSLDQSKRARWVFEKALEEDGVSVISRVAETSYFFPEAILESKTAKHQLVLEYAKIVYYRLNGWI